MDTHIHTHGQYITIHMYTPARLYIQTYMYSHRAKPAYSATLRSLTSKGKPKI